MILGLSSGKAPVADAIHAEVYKAGGTTLVSKSNDLFKQMCDLEEIPQEFKDTSISLT